MKNHIEFFDLMRMNFKIYVSENEEVNIKKINVHIVKTHILWTDISIYLLGCENTEAIHKVRLIRASIKMQFFHYTNFNNCCIFFPLVLLNVGLLFSRIKVTNSQTMHLTFSWINSVKLKKKKCTKNLNSNIQLCFWYELRKKNTFKLFFPNSKDIRSIFIGFDTGDFW